MFHFRNGFVTAWICKALFAVLYSTAAAVQYSTKYTAYAVRPTCEGENANAKTKTTAHPGAYYYYYGTVLRTAEGGGPLDLAPALLLKFKLWIQGTPPMPIQVLGVELG